MNKINNIIYKLFSIGAILLFSWAGITALVFPIMMNVFSLHRKTYELHEIIRINIINAILALGLFLLAKYVISKCFNNIHISNKKTYIFLGLELILYAIVIIGFINYVGFSTPIDDTKNVLNSLQFLNEQGHFPGHYMYSNPQNLFLMLVFNVIIQIFGYNYSIIMFSFLLLHILTIFITFLALKSINLTNLTSLIAIQPFIFALQVSIHTAIAYTDILSLFFIASSVFLIIKIIQLENNSNGNFNKKQLMYLILLSVIASIGFLTKGTVLIIIIAIAVFLFLVMKKYKKLYFFIPFLIFLLVNSAWNQGIQNQHLFPDNNYGQPNTHYLMMGVGGADIPDNLSSEEKSLWTIGMYDSEDQQFTWDLFLNENISTKELQSIHLDKMTNRLSSLTSKEFLEFLNQKVASTWSTGDLKSTFSLRLGIEDKEKIKFLKDGSSGLIIYSLMMIIQFIIYLGIISSAIKYFNSPNLYVYFSNIFYTGYFVFLLIWEASPRYSIAIFPLAIISIGLFLKNGKVPIS